MDIHAGSDGSSVLRFTDKNRHNSVAVISGNLTTFASDNSCSAMQKRFIDFGCYEIKVFVDQFSRVSDVCVTVVSSSIASLLRHRLSSVGITKPSHNVDSSRNVAATEDCKLSFSDI
jgi:hypothetical protein